MSALAGTIGRLGTAIGTWSQIASPEIVDILGAVGFDFIVIDTEHGFFGLETAENLVRACDAADVVPLVRVPANEPYLITKALDAGAAGVIVPRIGSEAEAQAALAAARYGPRGSRGACPCVRSGRHFVADWPGYARRADETADVIPLIETEEAVACIDAILRLPNLRTVMLGPFDLSVAMGHDGDVRHPEVTTVLERVVAAAGAAAVEVVMPIFSPAADETRRQVERWQAKGVRAFTVGTDKLLLASCCRDYLAAVR